MRSSSSSISTFISTLFVQVILQSCNHRSSRVLQILRCAFRSACHCLSSADECEFCCGAGGIILLLVLRSVFLLAFFRTSSLLGSPQAKLTLLGERKRTAVQQVPSQNPRKHHHTSQPPPKKEKQARQSQQAPQAHLSKSQHHSQTRHEDHPTSHSKNCHSSPSPPL